MGNGLRSIGFVGLGLMGAPMARRIARAGHALAVWNRTAEKAAPVVAEGARLADGPAAAARGADVVCLCLTDGAAVEAAVFGPGGVAEGIGRDAVLVDFSSIAPDAARDFARRLRERTGAGWIDAPVSGGVPGAEGGRLVVMAGGEPAEFERVRPLLAHLSARATLMGANGAGQATKLVNQMLVGCALAVLAEAVQFARDAGVDAALIPAALAGGRADSPVLQHFLPKMAAGDYALEGAIRIILKDLDNAREQAKRTGAAVPMTGLAAELHRLMVKKGHGGEDNAALARLYRPDDPV